MKVEYGPHTDTLTIPLREARMRESDELRPGVIVDFGEDGAAVRFEILDASKVVDRTRAKPRRWRSSGSRRLIWRLQRHWGLHCRWRSIGTILAGGH